MSSNGSVEEAAMALGKGELVPRGDQALSTEVADFYAEHAGEGAGFAADQVAMPMMLKMEPLSKLVQSGEFPDAKPGVFAHTSTMTFHERFTFVPVFFQMTRSIWRGRTKGDMGQLDRFLEDNEHIDTEFDEENRRFMVAGHPELTYVESYQYFAIIFGQDGEDLGPGMFQLRSTQIKHAKKLNGFIQTRTIERAGKKVRAPIYAYRYRASTMEETNARGQKFHSYSFMVDGPVTDRELAIQAQSFHESLRGKGADELRDEAAAATRAAGEAEE